MSGRKVKSPKSTGKITRFQARNAVKLASRKHKPVKEIPEIDMSKIEPFTMACNNGDFIRIDGKLHIVTGYYIHG